MGPAHGRWRRLSEGVVEWSVGWKEMIVGIGGSGGEFTL